MITILEETPKDPIELIGRRAGICYGADITNPEKNYKRGIECIENDHGRALEFVDVHMFIAGYSARVMREYERHIAGCPPYLQESTRYINYAKDGFEVITPQSIQKNPVALVKWNIAMKHLKDSLADLVVNLKIPKEDVANGLPIGMKTKIVEKRGLRNLISMSRVRECTRAYWEFRTILFEDIKKALSEYSPQWKELVELTFMPKCKYLGFCNEKKSCGRKVRRVS